MIRLWIVISIIAGVACSPAATDCAAPIARGDLVITEVFASGQEWFEIYNASGHALVLDGLELAHSHAGVATVRTHVVDGATIASGQYLVLGAVEPDAAPPFIDYGYGGDLGDLRDGGSGALALSCGGRAIASVSYGDVVGGHSRELGADGSPVAGAAQDPANWCESDATEFAAGQFGTPGQDSDCVPLAQGQCQDGGSARDVVPPSAGDLVIDEIMASPARVPDANGEWFELAALHDVDLNGLALSRGDDGMADVLASPACLRAAAGSFTVFARSTDASRNGGIANAAGAFSFALVGGSPVAPGELEVSVGDDVIDAAEWTAAPDGASLSLDPTRLDAIANDDDTSWCAAMSPYGAGDLGTPGAANPACPRVAPIGMCVDAEGGEPRPIVPPAPGQLAITEVMPNPSGDETAREWIEIANLGSASFDLSGLALDRADDSRPPDVIGGAACLAVAPGGFALAARSQDPARNGGLPAVDATFGFTLVNAGGSASVLAADGSTLATATWTATTDGSSIQLDPRSGRWCAGTAPYGDGTNRGTPRAPDTPCPP